MKYMTFICGFTLTLTLLFLVCCGKQEFSGADGEKNNKSARGDSQESAKSDSSEILTNVQEAGVDEADFIKVAKEHLYVLRDTEVEVADREDIGYVGSFKLERELRNINLFTNGSQFIVLGNYQKFGYQTGVSDSTAEVTLYRAKRGHLPKRVRTWEFSGQVADARLVKDRLLVVLRDEAVKGSYERPYGDASEERQDEDRGDDWVLEDEDGRVRGIPCENILQPTADDDDLRLTKIVSIDLRDPDAEPETAGVMGGGDQIYMTAENLYLTKSGGMGGFRERSYGEGLIITKLHLDLDSGKVEPEAAGMIDGYVKDQWAFKEYVEGDEELLAVVTTDNTGGLTNHLWMLQANPEDQNLDVVASIRDFGETEDVRAVRYIDDTAYVVTFKKTDPLFAFDLSDPYDPVTLDELKIPGFSTYLHPIGDERMIGVGFDALDRGGFAWFQGIQISLFDVSDPRELRRIDNVVLGERGSSSEVTSDHHAFYFDEEREILGVPVVQLGRGRRAQDWEYGDRAEFTGAVMYKVSDTLEEIGRISHTDFIPRDCKASTGSWWQDAARSIDINRLLMVDDRLLSFSRFGIKAHDPRRPEKVKAKLSFEVPAKLCRRLE